MDELEELVSKGVVSQVDQVFGGKFKLYRIYLNELVNTVQEKYENRRIELIDVGSLSVIYYLKIKRKINLRRLLNLTKLWPK